MSRILFSPIGSSDPIKHYSDGSMLHICRYYKPDKVYLYLTYEMFEHHKKDNRYLYCIEELGKLYNHNFQVELIKREDLKNVQDYEFFYEEFRKCIEKIEETMLSEDELLINISSGTPAMKNALLILSAFAEYPFKPIQVSTPLQKGNEDINTYDVELQWNCNVDNEVFDTNHSRCEEVKTTNLLTLFKVNMIKKYVTAYDYVAAYKMAGTMRNQMSDDGKLYLEQAVERLQLNQKRVFDIAKRIGYQPIPIRSDNDRELIEYILQLQIKVARGNYDDFIRAITPVIVKLFERVLKKQCHINIANYCKDLDKNQWDKEKLKESEESKKIDNILNESFFNFNYKYVSSIHLKELIIFFSENRKVNALVESLRDIEEKARNKAAHTMVSITQEMIENWTGVKSEEILEKIKKLAMFLIPKTEDDIWSSYDYMNKTICSVIEKEAQLASNK